MIASFSQRQCLCHSSFEYQIRFDVHQRGQLVRIEPARLPRLRLKYLGQELLQRAILYCGRAEAEFELVHIQMPPPLQVLPHQVGLGGGFAGTGWAGHQNPHPVATHLCARCSPVRKDPQPRPGGDRFTLDSAEVPAVIDRGVRGVDRQRAARDGQRGEEGTAIL